jgi:hypothetical protein
MASLPRLRRAEDALEPRLFGQLRRAVKGLGQERLKSTYQTTFWFDLGRPRCLPEAAALALRPRIPPGRRVVGVEWWLSRMRTSDVQVDFHRDRDERLALLTGRIVHPRWSSVFFLNRCRGGLLAVTDEPPCEDNPALAPRVLDLDLVRPSPNRFVVFDGRMTHGVLDEKNRIPGRRSRVHAAPGPLRLAVIFNWWHRRPLDVPRWDETRIYRSLALPPVRAAGRGPSPAAR